MPQVVVVYVFIYIRLGVTQCAVEMLHSVLVCRGLCNTFCMEHIHIYIYIYIYHICTFVVCTSVVSTSLMGYL